MDFEDTPEEAAFRAECRTCHPYLRFEMRALHPRLAIAVGARAAEAVLGEPVKICAEHGRRRRIHDIEVLTVIAPSPFNRVSLKRLELTIDSYQLWLTGLFGALIDELGA